MQGRAFGKLRFCNTRLGLPPASFFYTGHFASLKLLEKEERKKKKYIFRNFISISKKNCKFANNMFLFQYRHFDYYVC